MSAKISVSNTVENVFGVRPGERAPVFWSFLYFFCILASYFMIRSIRESVGSEFGGQNVPWLFTGTFVAMLVVAPIFGWIASRFPRRRFLPWIYAFFAANMLLFWFGFNYVEGTGSREAMLWIGGTFFIWLSVFNLFVVSVFWSFMADIYSASQSRRLFGLISAGGSAGAMLGPAVTGVLSTEIGFTNILPLSALLLLCSIFCIARLRRWVETQHSDEIERTAASEKPLGGSFLQGAAATFQSRFFLLISAASIIASLLGTALYMFMADLMREAYPLIDERTSVFAFLDSITNTLAFVFQLLVVKHAVSRLGIGMTLFILPAISIAGFVLLALNPTLAVVAALQVVRRSVGFGFSKPTNDMLYSVVSAREKYKVKNFIDTAIYRGGDVISTWGIRAVLSLGIAGIALLLLPFALIWGFCAIALGREYRRRESSQHSN